MVPLVERLAGSDGRVRIRVNRDGLVQRPSGRNLLEDMHLLKGGVTLKVHAYVKGVKEYGKAPGF